MALPHAEQPDSRDPLHTVLSGYLSTLAAIADCVGEACPEVGAPYRQRLHRLRTRLAFQVSPVAVEESAIAVAQELDDYAGRAAGYLQQCDQEMGRTITALEQTVRLMAQRQDFYGARLRQFAAQMEVTQYPTEPEHLGEVVALQVAGLLSVVESMSNEARSLVGRMQAELEAAEQRLEEAEVADPITGLLNHQEMVRQLEARRQNPDLVVLRFTLSIAGDAPLPDEVVRAIGEKLSSHFRHRDLIARWSPDEFLVLFDGASDVAQARTRQALPWLAGTYPLTDGSTVELTVEAGLADLQHLLPVETPILG